MTKIRETKDSSMIDDRRGQSGGGGGGGGLGGLGDVLGRMGGGGGLGGGGGGGGMGGLAKGGGGLIGILLMLAVAFLPKLLKGATPAAGLPASPSASAASNDGTCNDELESILCGATIDVQTFWQQEFRARGEEYEVTKTVFFSGSTDTGCGTASSQTGPFYCPADHLVYFDLDFLVQLQNQFDAKGDLAAQYIVAHEYGHHLQNILGTNAKVQQAQQNNPGQANQYSVALELQADCYAGVWAKDAAARNMFENDQEIEEALNAAAAVGDDRIQMKMQGRVDPESFTHGTSEQRVSWFRRGYTTGDRDRCDTFNEVG